MSLFSKIVRKVEKKIIRPVAKVIPKPIRKPLAAITIPGYLAFAAIKKPSLIPGIKSPKTAALIQTVARPAALAATAIAAPFALPFASQALSFIKPVQQEVSYEYTGAFGPDTVGPVDYNRYPSFSVPWDYYAAPTYPSWASLFGGGPGSPRAGGVRSPAWRTPRARW